MKRIIRILLAGWVAVFLTSCADTRSMSTWHDGNKIEERGKIILRIPYYFIAVHNEPFNHDQSGSKIEEAYPVLRKMVRKADRYHIKLTIMLAAPWADYILASSERAAELASWRANGHEIAAHHHSTYHPGKWDGYSNLPRIDAEQQRRSLGHESETYFGTMNDFIDQLRRINPDIKSGCLNDEHNKNVLPDEIIYDTCSGFENYGEPGSRKHDFDPEKGKNEYITVGTYKGIDRKWLTHHFMPVSAEPAKDIFKAMRSGVYGTVNHSAEKEYAIFSDYLNFLHRIDPKGIMSRTVSDIIEENLLPEQRISGESLTAVYEKLLPFKKRNIDH